MIYIPETFLFTVLFLICPNSSLETVEKGDKNDNPLRTHLVATFGLSQNQELTCFSLSPNGKWIAIGTESGEIIVWSTKHPKKPKIILRPPVLGNSKHIHHLSFSPDGKRLACVLGERNGSAQVWSIRARKRLWGTHGIRHPSGIAFSPDGKHLAVTDQRNLQFYTTDGKYLWTGKIDTALRTFIDFTPKRNVITGGHGSAAIRIWDWKTGKLLKRYGINQLTALACDPKNGNLVVGALGKYLSVFESDSGKTIYSRPAQSNNSLQVFAIPKTKGLYLAGTDGSLVTIHDRKTGREITRLSTWSSDRLVVTRDGTLFAVPVGARKLGLWKIQLGTMSR